MGKEKLTAPEAISTSFFALTLACGMIAVGEAHANAEEAVVMADTNEAYIPEELDLPTAEFSGMIPKTSK